jgi:hypothetical protein
VDDYRAVENLIASYAALVDAGDFAGVGALFAAGAFVGSGGAVRGAAEVERMLRESVIVYEDGTPRTKHVTTNIALEVSGPVASGRYEDRFTREAGRWRFTERRATMDLVGDVSHHLRAKGS